MLIATVKGKCVRRIIVVPVITNVYKLRLRDFWATQDTDENVQCYQLIILKCIFDAVCKIS